jgi:hypothetical protein
MKKVTITLLTFLLTATVGFAQAPQAFKYQAVARDGGGEVLANQYISLRVSIISGSADGSIVYTETHNARTTGLGLVNLNIGEGEYPTSAFSEIDWGSGNHYINIEMDPDGGSSYIQMGTAQLLSVPYALYALRSGDGRGKGKNDLWEEDEDSGNIYNENSGNVGVGTNFPDAQLHVVGTFKVVDGTEGSGKVLTSNALGLASWADPNVLITETDPVFSTSAAFGILNTDITNWNDAFGWGDHALAGYLTAETDPVFGSSAAFGIVNTDITNWNTAFGWGDHALAGYLTSESDPVFSASDAFTITGTDIMNWDDAYGWGDHALAGYLSSESDPVFGASAAFGISALDIANWNTAFSWGDHNLAGYLTVETDPLFSTSPAFGIAALDIINWNTAYSWGDHAAMGYLTSEIDPAFTASPAFGISALDILNWNTAYGWGDHALAGYLTTETDPVFSASDAFSISAFDIMNWDDAYGWGDHALEGYLTSETDPVFSASDAFGITNTDIGNWNTAFGWGDHSLAGYLTAESDPIFSASPAFGIAALDILNWNAAFAWGDHALVGYLTTETDGSTTNEIQSLSLSGNTLSLSLGGGSVLLGLNPLVDADGDTKVQVEKNSDDDHIRFDVRNTEVMVIDSMGNIGIGVAVPDTTLHISKGIKVDEFAKGNVLDSLVTWNPADSTLRLIPASSVGGGGGIGVVPDPSIPVPIAFQGDTLWVHPTDNASDVDWATAATTCSDLTAYGKDDWVMPSRIQLDAIYKQSYLLTGLEQFNDWKYWSSTEQDTDNAFSQRMDYGGPDPDPKTDAGGHRVRCIREN